MKNKTLNESSKLNDYHQKRNEHAIKVVEEMSKEPYTLEQMREQAMILSNQMDGDSDEKNP
jgi:benzoyl-CoA reductase/2-hydroxyglutaryl-CoA dehydratase subunit BcrC/BadD/HgdB